MLETHGEVRQLNRCRSQAWPIVFQSLSFHTSAFLKCGYALFKGAGFIKPLDTVQRAQELLRLHQKTTRQQQGHCRQRHRLLQDCERP